jgi:hypothetical protein
MRDHFRVYIGSNDAKATTDSKPWDFTAEFKRPLVLDGAWEVALEELHYYNIPGAQKRGFSIEICCDCIDNSYVAGELKPILRNILQVSKNKIDDEYRHLHYVPVTRNVLNNLRIYMKTDKGTLPPLGKQPSRVTLSFRRTGSLLERWPNQTITTSI